MHYSYYKKKNVLQMKVHAHANNYIPRLQDARCNLRHIPILKGAPCCLINRCMYLLFVDKELKWADDIVDFRFFHDHILRAGSYAI